MSLSQLQEAMAELIRLPELNRGDEYPAFEAKYELDTKEKEELSHMAADRLVTKYGRAMAFVRWETIQKQTPFTKFYWNTEAIEYIWRHRFEPTAAYTRFMGLGKAFLDFVVENERAREIIAESCPDFLPDLFKFERAQAAVRLENKTASRAPSSKSLLVHSAYHVDTYDHRISEFVLKIAETGHKVDGELVAPQKGKETLLILPKGNSSNCRFFQVEPELIGFLESLENLSPPDPLPDYYGDLVSLGLCKPLN